MTRLDEIRKRVAAAWLVVDLDFRCGVCDYCEEREDEEGEPALCAVTQQNLKLERANADLLWACERIEALERLRDAPRLKRIPEPLPQNARWNVEIGQGRASMDTKLKAHLALRGLRLLDLARLLRVPVSTLSGWVREAHPGPPDLRQRIELALGLAPGALSYELPAPASDVDVPQQDQNNDHHQERAGRPARDPSIGVRWHAPDRGATEDDDQQQNQKK